MMYGIGLPGGWWLLMMVMMLIFWLAIIALVIWAVRSLFPRHARTEREQALALLLQRFASGEISAAEYEQAHARLEDIPVA